MNHDRITLDDIEAGLAIIDEPDEGLFDPLDEEGEEDHTNDDADEAYDPFFLGRPWAEDVAPSDCGGVDMRKLDLYIG